MKQQMEGKLLQLEKDYSMLDCDYKQAQLKLEDMHGQKEILSEEVSFFACQINFSWVVAAKSYHGFLNSLLFPPAFSHSTCLQVKQLTLRLEQETQKRNLMQNDLKMQNQQVSALRSSEKQFKQDLNHLKDMKQILDKQNQELRRSDCTVSENAVMLLDASAHGFLVSFQGKTRD